MEKLDQPHRINNEELLLKSVQMIYVFMYSALKGTHSSLDSILVDVILRLYVDPSYDQDLDLESFTPSLEFPEFSLSTSVFKKNYFNSY